MNHFKTNSIDKRILAIDPCSVGFGYAILEGQFRLIDWGTKYVKPGNSKTFFRKSESLIDYFQPNVLVTEDYSGKGSRRWKRIEKLIDGIVKMARKRRIKIHQYSRGHIKQIFVKSDSPISKHQIAIELSRCFPQLIPQLPKSRGQGRSEDSRMNVFDAIALAIAFYHHL